MWPADPAKRPNAVPSLSEVIETLSTLGKSQLPAQLARWLDGLDETGRWALLKLVTGGLRIGVSARLAKTAAASLGGKEPNEIEILWPGLAPPYAELFAWLEGRADMPVSRDPAPFRPAMLAHAIEDTDFAALDPHEFMAEWKWDGIRVQAVTGAGEDGRAVTRLYSRTGEDISKSFPDLAEALRLPGAIDGELLIVRDGRVQSFNVLQQRLNRKAVTPKLLLEFPAHLRAYDLLVDGTEDLRDRPFAERRARLQAFVEKLDDPRVDLSPLVPFDTWEALTAARADPAAAGAGADAEAVEGVMLKRRDARLRARAAEGPVVEMEARSAHRRRGADVRPARPRQALVVLFRLHVRGLDQGRERRRAGAGRQGLFRLHRRGIAEDRPLRAQQHHRAVRPGARGDARGATRAWCSRSRSKGLQRSTRHKSGLAMRFPRISRLRWDKPPREADRLETLEKMLARIETGRGEAPPSRHRWRRSRRRGRDRAKLGRFGRFAWLTTSIASSAGRRSRCSASSSCCRS